MLRVASALSRLPDSRVERAGAVVGVDAMRDGVNGIIAAGGAASAGGREGEVGGARWEVVGGRPLATTKKSMNRAAGQRFYSLYLPWICVGALPSSAMFASRKMSFEYVTS